LEALGINGTFLLVQIVNLIIAYVVIAKWIVAPIVSMLEKRRKTVAQGLEDAKVAADARANAEKEAEKILAEAQSKAAHVVREATERADLATRDVYAAAEADASQARAKAIAEVEDERNRILGDLRGQVAALSIAATQKLVNEALDEKKQRSLIDEFFSGIKSGKITVLEGAKVDGAAAVVTSALPLTSAEQESAKKDVMSNTGAKEVSFKVDPAILGGLVIKVGDKIVDDSVSGKLEALRSNLK